MVRLVVQSAHAVVDAFGPMIADEGGGSPVPGENPLHAGKPCDPHGTPSDEAGVRSVQRAIELLQLFDPTHRVWSIRALADACALPKTTVVRLVATLEHRGVLWRRQDGLIAIGPALLRWADLARSAWELPEAAREVMSDLSRRSRETVNLYVRSGTNRVCIAQHEGPQNLRHVVSVGDELPLWAGAAGKVLLAGADDAFVGAVAACSPAGPAHHTELWDQVRSAAASGYAVTHGEPELGASGVAAPVHDGEGRVVAALALGGPSARFTPERVKELIAEVVAAAQSLSLLDLTHLGAGPPPRPSDARVRRYAGDD